MVLNNVYGGIMPTSRKDRIILAITLALMLLAFGYAANAKSEDVKVVTLSLTKVDSRFASTALGSRMAGFLRVHNAPAMLWTSGIRSGSW
jgi:hypothetical protein